MTGKPSRRQWLLGLVAGVFGAGIARAVGRVLPGKPETPPTSGRIYYTTRSADGTTKIAWVPLEGKIEVEPSLPAGTFRLTHRDAHGRVLTQVDGLVEEWVEVDTQQAANTTSYTYDAGNVMQVTDPLGHVTKYQYDARGRLLSPHEDEARAGDA